MTQQQYNKLKSKENVDWVLTCDLSWVRSASWHPLPPTSRLLAQPSSLNFSANATSSSCATSAGSRSQCNESCGFTGDPRGWLRHTTRQACENNVIITLPMTCFLAWLVKVFVQNIVWKSYWLWAINKDLKHHSATQKTLPYVSRKQNVKCKCWSQNVSMYLGSQSASVLVKPGVTLPSLSFTYVLSEFQTVTTSTL